MFRFLKLCFAFLASLRSAIVSKNIEVNKLVTLPARFNYILDLLVTGFLMTIFAGKIVAGKQEINAKIVVSNKSLILLSSNKKLLLYF